MNSIYLDFYRRKSYRASASAKHKLIKQEMPT